MTIYATPFRASDLQTTGPSTDSGFESLDQVIELMGDEHIVQTPRLIVYGPGEDQIVYSRDLTFGIDEPDNSK